MNALPPSLQITTKTPERQICLNCLSGLFQKHTKSLETKLPQSNDTPKIPELDMSGVLWTHEDWHKKEAEFRAQFKAEGMSEMAIIFAVSKAMSDYVSRQPSMRQRQEYYAKIKPKTLPKIAFALTSNELEWLLTKLEGVNDPIGQDILARLKNLDQHQSK